MKFPCVMKLSLIVDIYSFTLPHQLYYASPEEVDTGQYNECS